MAIPPDRLATEKCRETQASFIDPGLPLSFLAEDNSTDDRITVTVITIGETSPLQISPGDFLPPKEIEDPVVLRSVSRSEAKKEIHKLFQESDILYYSDIAGKLALDLELVVEVCDELMQEGKIEESSE